MMRDRAELIGTLMAAVDARREEAGGLHLPGWGRPEWEALLGAAEVVEIRDGELLIRRDEPNRELFFLVEGQLEVTVPQSDSMTFSPMARIRPGSIVGEIAFLDGGARSASVWSRGPTVLFAIEKEAYAAFRRDRPALACDLMQAVAQILAVRLRRTLGGSGREQGGGRVF
jgi:CRP-like cAMP-binding protein